MTLYLAVDEGLWARVDTLKVYIQFKLWIKLPYVLNYSFLTFWLNQQLCVFLNKFPSNCRELRGIDTKFLEDPRVSSYHLYLTLFHQLGGQAFWHH